MKDDLFNTFVRGELLFFDQRLNPRDVVNDKNVINLHFSEWSHAGTLWPENVNPKDNEQNIAKKQKRKLKKENFYIHCPCQKQKKSHLKEKADVLLLYLENHFQAN